MPIYTFKCEVCGVHKDRFCSVDERDKPYIHRCKDGEPSKMFRDRLEKVWR